jgi:hypothetical protein
VSDARRPAPAAPPIRLGIAGLQWSVEVDDPAWREALAPRYAPFFEGGAAVPQVEVELRATSRPVDLAEFWRQVCAEPFRASRERGHIILASASTRVELDCERRRVFAHGPLNRHVLDVALRSALPLFVPDSLLVHAALLGDGRRSWLAAGPSGCGKSTLAALFPQRRGCDELALVQRLGGAWHVHALPFWHGLPGVAPLAAVHLLRQAREDSRRRLSETEAMQLLGREVLWPDDSTATLAAAWQRLGDLVEAVPVYELSFRPTPQIWELLVAEEAA